MRNSEQETNEDMRLVTTERERWIKVLSKNPNNGLEDAAEEYDFE